MKNVRLLLGAAILPLFTLAQQPKISSFRAYDKTGINVFEDPKDSMSTFNGLAVRFGSGFTQQFQSLKHENTAANNQGTATNNAQINRLYPLTPGFMTAQANLYMDVQLADGIKLNVTSYLSARHHNEYWVKGGYIQFDKVPFKGKFWDDFMKLATIKVGHFEVNYGDAHFRRSDGGNTLYNPFMDNNIMDAFTTEIGGEVYVRKNGLFGMVGVTTGMIKGNVDSIWSATVADANNKKSPSIYLKAGYDKMVAENIRVRLSASYYTNKSSAGSGNTLFWGDRTGSNYQNVMEKWVAAPGASAAAQSYTAIPWSGRFNPGFSKKVSAFVLNGFVKISGFELFGTIESAKGNAKAETTERKANQFAIDGVYRFGKSENAFIGVKYNTLSATTPISGVNTDIKINRTAFAAGWFVTKNVLMKAEIVNQKYIDFPSSDYRNGGKFNGLVIEAIVGF